MVPAPLKVEPLSNMSTPAPVAVDGKAEVPPTPAPEVVEQSAVTASTQSPTAATEEAGDSSDPRGFSPDGVQAVRDQQEELEHVSTAIRSFRTAVGENPIGTNAEITSALRGDNLKQVRVELPPNSKISEAGELIDQWSTPYFFHQVSAREMEIRSAGPDRKMWTDDDLEVK
jgi:hypothetical protein